MNPAPPRAALFAIDRGSETMRWPEGEIALPPLSIHKYSWIERRQCYLMLTRQLYSGYSKTKFFSIFCFMSAGKTRTIAVMQAPLYDRHKIRYHKNWFPIHWWMTCTCLSYFFFLQISFSWLTNGSSKYQARKSEFQFSNLILMLFRWRWIWSPRRARIYCLLSASRSDFPVWWSGSTIFIF